MAQEEDNPQLQLLQDLRDREESTSGRIVIRPDLARARDAAVSWLHEACLEQRWSCLAFTGATCILDRFLTSCPSVRPEQAQLAAATCMVLASKKSDDASAASIVRALVEYADGSILAEEIRVSKQILHLSRFALDLQNSDLSYRHL